MLEQKSLCDAANQAAERDFLEEFMKNCARRIRFCTTNVEAVAKISFNLHVSANPRSQASSRDAVPSEDEWHMCFSSGDERSSSSEEDKEHV